jgi:hypothetical protein
MQLAATMLHLSLSAGLLPCWDLGHLKTEKAVNQCLWHCVTGGLSSPVDEAFATSFADLYSAPSLQVPWYTILGKTTPPLFSYRRSISPCSTLPCALCPTHGSETAFIALLLIA